jgi:hypothetical protein
MKCGGPGSGRHAGGQSTEDAERQDRLETKQSHEAMRDKHAQGLQRAVKNGDSASVMSHTNALVAHQRAADAYADLLSHHGNGDDGRLSNAAQSAHDAANTASALTRFTK